MPAIIYPLLPLAGDTILPVSTPSPSPLPQPPVERVAPVEAHPFGDVISRAVAATMPLAPGGMTFPRLLP